MTDLISPVSPVGSPLGVASVNSDTSRLSTPENLKKAGQQFEAIFTQMMLKSMRSAHLADDILSSKALDTFREMQDQKIAQTLAINHPLGIGKAVTDFLAKSQPNLQAPAGPAPAPNNGGAA